MDNTNIKFSIITPVYNREDCIARCIESVIKQDYPEKEMWIIDDGSTDNTSQIIKSYLPEYPFIKFHKFDTNRGVNAARNHGIQNSTGDYIILLDSDDQLVEDILRSVSNIIIEHPQYKHFLLATDDRISYYEHNSYLNNHTNVLSFKDFLMGRISGDFFHIIDTNLMKRYPFNENLRIYEGLNFLKIYKDGENQFFSNQIAVRRERDRSDSVTLEYKLINSDAIKKKYSANTLQLKLFNEDYHKYDEKRNFAKKMIKETYLLGLASGNYDLESLDSLMQERGKKIPFLYKLICRLRLGAIVRRAINTYSKSKTAIK